MIHDRTSAPAGLAKVIEPVGRKNILPGTLAAYMRLSDFILANTPAILDEWDAFARSLWPRTAPSPEDLRDHAEAILRAAALDMKAPQSALQQSLKAKGLAVSAGDPSALTKASDQHAMGRAASGFDLRAVMAEYRALRASVVRLWFESIPEPHKDDLADLTRFHEAIDQSLTEAVHQYTEHIDHSRQLFLGILGHDLRTPINAMSISAQAMADMRPQDEEHTRLASQIVSSAEAAGQMLNDLLDFAVSRLGRSMPVTPVSMDLEALCREVIAEVRASLPHGSWNFEASGDLRGEWDRARLRQVLSNLVCNAVQHGNESPVVTVSAKGEGDHVTLRVHNGGPPIPAALLPRVFDPFVRASRPLRSDRNIGLGLYIVHEVVGAHGGQIEVTSTQESGTAFTITLPRRPVRRNPPPLETG